MIVAKNLPASVHNQAFGILLNPDLFSLSQEEREKLQTEISVITDSGTPNERLNFLRRTFDNQIKMAKILRRLLSNEKRLKEVIAGKEPEDPMEIPQKDSQPKPPSSL